METIWQNEDLGAVTMKGYWSMFSILIVVVGIRIYCRVAFSRHGVGADDWLTILCLVVNLIDCVFATIAISYGLGKHINSLDPADATLAGKWTVICAVVHVWVFSLPKFAIVAILKRILDFEMKTGILFWGLCITSQLCVLTTSVWWVWQCSPPAHGWDRSVEGTCAPVSVLQNIGYFTSAYSAFLDMFFALYPVPFIMKMNLPLKTRISISLAMSLSMLACAMSVYKLAIFQQVFSMRTSDPTYAIPYLFLLGFAEGFVLLVGSSLPTMGPLFRAAKRKISTVLSSSDDSTSSHTRNSGGHSDASSKRWKISKRARLEDHQRTLDSIDAMPLHPLEAVTCGGNNSIPKTVGTCQFGP